MTCRGKPSAAAWASSSTRRTPCIATRPKDAFTLVSSPTTSISPAVRASCSARVLSLPLDQLIHARGSTTPQFYMDVQVNYPEIVGRPTNFGWRHPHPGWRHRAPTRGARAEAAMPRNAPALHVPTNPVRFVTAASLFDGHDAAINIMRRVLQSQGAEVIHLGHDRSVDEVVAAAVAEDVQGVAISSYQGGHVEYFKYLVDRLRAEGRGDIKVFGGGGGVIIPSEIAELEEYGVRKIFSPADGQLLGLAQMINVLIKECDVDLANQNIQG